MTTIATHSGPFHADDVMAVALLRRFVVPDATVLRTRSLERIAACELVVDVGGVYDPALGRFDHHQLTYTGPLSSAGMVVRWLADCGRISASLSAYLQAGVVDYVDGVDTGRVAPKAGVPCFPRMVEAMNALASTEEAFDGAFARSVDIGLAWIDGLVAEHERIEAAAAVVRAAMDRAAATGSNLLEFDSYINWKPAYYANGGEHHPTEFVLFPGTDGTWRIIAIPPREGEFGQKVSLPEAWAGLTEADLVAVTGIAGACFCHKNRFIAVFKTRDEAVLALQQAGLVARA